MGLFDKFKKDKGEKDADLAGIIGDAANEALSGMGFTGGEETGDETKKEFEKEVECEIEEEVKKEMDSEEFRENIEEEIKKKFGFLG